MEITVVRGPARVTNLSAPVHSLSSTVDDLANRFERAEPSSSRVHNSPPPLAIQHRMYLFYVYSTSLYFCLTLLLKHKQDSSLCS